MRTKVSVIIPVYGVERFIVRCVRSLMEQTLQEVEFIFVNDATQDKSMELLKTELDKFPQRKKQVRILNHERNIGLPAARNTGLAIARGEYVLHCDSDDYLASDALASLYHTGQQCYSDIVWCDWFLTFEHGKRYMKEPQYATAYEALKGMLGGAMKYNVWNKLIKRELYTDNNINFPEKYGMGEDMTIMRLFACARQVTYVSKALYYYVKTNTNSFCQTYSNHHLEELRCNVQLTTDFIRTKYGNLLEKELAYMKLEAKFPFLISNGSNNQYQNWSLWYPEANPYIMQNSNTSIRRRLLQWCAWKKQFWIVWLYYQLVNRLVYGVIYK